jgi:hypothetical protein
VPQVIGTVVSRRLATLHELETVYGSQDLYDLMDIIMVDDYNQGVINGNRN